jgi:hypothetical protein
MPDPEFDPRPILDVLVRHEVDFVLIGGLAGTALGSAYVTYDVGVAYERSNENLERVAAALDELGATLRGAPPGLPFLLDAETLRAGLNFTFDTKFGSLDILGEPAGAPRYEELRAAGSSEAVWGVTVRIASLDHLIAMKEAAGRDKDKLHASEYRVISDLLRAPKDDEPG